MTRTAPALTGTPPAPYRTSPWYDPALYEAELAAARAEEPSRPALRRRWTAFVLVVLGGVVLPVGSLVMNALIDQVVHLDVVGTALLALGVVSTLLNLLLYPTRKDGRGRTVVVRAPRAVWARVLLLGGAVLNIVFWGYLSVLFLPLVPVSVPLVVFGIGLCGLCPFAASAIGIIQARRATAALRERTSATGAALAVVAFALTPVLAAVGLGLHARHQVLQVEARLEQVAAAPRHSTARIRAIATLQGAEDAVVALYRQTHAHPRRRLLSEVYQRLTDTSLSAHTWRQARRQRAIVQPWWFLEGHDPLAFHPFDPTRNLLRGF